MQFRLTVNTCFSPLVLALLLLAACASTPAYKDQTGATIPGSVAFMDKIELGGIPQFVCVRGVSEDKPVLLFLHGGPGSAETPAIRYYNALLEKEFLVANWDQRGAGKSYAPGIPRETMNIAQFIADAHELVLWLQVKYRKDKIYVVGHSWGSVLGSLLVQKYPEDFIAYVGLGQFVNGAENERLSYEFTLSEATSRNHNAAMEELKRIGAPHEGAYQGGRNSLMIQRKWLTAFGGALYGKSDATGLYIAALLGTTEYADLSILDYFTGVMFSLDTMWPEVVSQDLVSSIPALQVPVYLFAGRHDWNTPYPLAEAWFNQLVAPAKTLVWFDKSAHSPSFEEPAAFLEALLKMKAETE